MTAPVVVAGKALSPLYSPVFIIHNQAQAVNALRAAAAAGRAITLASPPDAGIYAGPGWFHSVVTAAREAVSAADSVALLDCGDDAGAAQAAIRQRIEGIVFIGDGDMAARLADIAAAHDIVFWRERPAVLLDLGRDFFAGPECLYKRCADALASGAGFWYKA